MPRIVYINGIGYLVKTAIIAEASQNANEVVAAITGYLILVLSINYSVAGTVNVKWQSGSTDLTGLDYCVVNNRFAADFHPAGHFATASGEALNAHLSAAVAIGGFLTYVEVPA